MTIKTFGNKYKVNYSSLRSSTSSYKKYISNGQVDEKQYLEDIKEFERLAIKIDSMLSRLGESVEIYLSKLVKYSVVTFRNTIKGEVRAKFRRVKALNTALSCLEKIRDDKAFLIEALEEVSKKTRNAVDADANLKKILDGFERYKRGEND